MSTVSSGGGSGQVGGVEEEIVPPESWPGAGGRRSSAPRTGAARPRIAGESWPGAAPARPAASRRGGATDDEKLDGVRLRRPAHQVSPKAKGMWALAALLSWVVPLVAVGAWMWFDDGHRTWQTIALAIVVVLAVVHAIVMPQWRFRVHRWEVDEAAVYTQTGWWHQERRLAPISRVQTVDSERGPLERLFGLGTVTVTTASAAGPLKISGLESSRVETMVADLTRVAARHRGDAT